MTSNDDISCHRKREGNGSWVIWVFLQNKGTIPFYLHFFICKSLKAVSSTKVVFIWEFKPETGSKNKLI